MVPTMGTVVLGGLGDWEDDTNTSTVDQNNRGTQPHPPPPGVPDPSEGMTFRQRKRLRKMQENDSHDSDATYSDAPRVPEVPSIYARTPKPVTQDDAPEARNKIRSIPVRPKNGKSSRNQKRKQRD